jgi:hypothetical protein
MKEKIQDRQEASRLQKTFLVTLVYEMNDIHPPPRHLHLHLS